MIRTIPTLALLLALAHATVSGAAAPDYAALRGALADAIENVVNQMRARDGGPPIGPADGVQILVLLHKDRDGRITETGIMPVKFQPLPGGQRL